MTTARACGGWQVSSAWADSPVYDVTTGTDGTGRTGEKQGHDANNRSGTGFKGDPYPE